MKSYAVFDFDDTSIHGDISFATMHYILHQGEIPFSPTELKEVLICLLGEKAGEHSLLIPALKKFYKTGRGSQSHRDFHLLFINEVFRVLAKQPIDLSLILLKGRTKTDIQEIARKAFTYKEGFDLLGLPSFIRPCAIFEASRKLQEDLRRVGIKPYICSASPRCLVQAIACAEPYGYAYHENEVFGVEMQVDKKGYYLPYIDSEAIFTHGEGKVTCIEKEISPRHQHEQAILIAGDGSGDIPMLEAFPKLQCALVWDRQEARGKIKEWKENLYQKAEKKNSQKNQAFFVHGIYHLFSPTNCESIDLRKDLHLHLT